MWNVGFMYIDITVSQVVWDQVCTETGTFIMKRQLNGLIRLTRSKEYLFFVIVIPCRARLLLPCYSYLSLHGQPGFSLFPFFHGR
jgi:hypothetical protein